MKKRVILYIVDSPWDENIIRWDRHLKTGCWVVLIVEGLYFGGMCLQALM